MEPVPAAARILVLGAGPSQLGLLAAARREGLTVVAADRDPAAPGFRYADRRALVAADDEPAVEQLARAESVDAIVGPASDRAAAVAARVARRLGIPHPLAPEAATTLASAQHRRTALLEAGVPVVEGTAAGSAQDAVVVTAFAVAGRLRPLTVADRAPAEGAARMLVWPSALAPPEVGAAVEVVGDAAAAVGIAEGPVTAVVLFFSDGPRLGDLSSRSGDEHEAELCRAAVGVDLNLLVLKQALGESVGAHELAAARRPGGACVRFLTAPAGTLRAVRGVEEAFALEGVRGIRIYHRPGWVFPAGARAGAVLTTGDTREQATARAERAAARIRFQTGRAEASVGG